MIKFLEALVNNIFSFLCVGPLFEVCHDVLLPGIFIVLFLPRLLKPYLLNFTVFLSVMGMVFYLQC